MAHWPAFLTDAPPVSTRGPAPRPRRCSRAWTPATSLGHGGFERWNLYAKIGNIANREPPYGASFPGIRAPCDFTQYDLRGRYFTLGFDHRF